MVKRCITILGTVLTIAIIMSGTAIAPTWHYAISVYDRSGVIEERKMLGPPDGVHGTITYDPPVIGWIILEMDGTFGRGANVTIWANSTVSERYRVELITSELTTPDLPWYEFGDTQDNWFTAPDPQGEEWLYVKLIALTGATGEGDPYPGPEIDAVGWS